MRVMSGVSFEQPDQTWRRLNLELDDTDLVGLIEEHRVPGVHLEWREDEREFVPCYDEGGERMTAKDRYRVLQRHADALLISQMHKEGAITDEDAKRQVESL